jgi:hypothetical protein
MMRMLYNRSHSEGSNGLTPKALQARDDEASPLEQPPTIRYVSRQEMESECPGICGKLPTQFLGRLPARVRASPQNAKIFRVGFDFHPGFVNDVFSRVRYVEGTEWPMWKLVAAFYLVQDRIGESAVRHAGEKIYSTMPWPPQVRTVADALRFTEWAYSESHLKAPRWHAGGWRVERETPTHMLLNDETPYPCHLNEGVVAAITRTFPLQKPRYRILDPAGAKRAGGSVTRYEIEFAPA